MVDSKVEQAGKTFFASPERVNDEELQFDIEIVSKNPVMSGLLTTIGGLIAVLNEQRQVVSLNLDFLSMLGIESPEKVLGLRPGEIVDCVHAHEEPGGVRNQPVLLDLRRGNSHCDLPGKRDTGRASMRSHRNAERS